MSQTLVDNLHYNTEAEYKVVEYFSDLGFDVECREKPESMWGDYNELTIEQQSEIKIRKSRGSFDIVIPTIAHQYYLDGSTTGVEHHFYFKVIRGTFISESVIKRFNGHFFILIPNGDISDPSKFRILWRNTIVNYYNKVEQYKKDYYIQHYGCKGFRFNNNFKYESTLDKFVLKLFNLFTANVAVNGGEFYKYLYF